MERKVFLGLILTLVIIVFIAVYWAMEPGRQSSAEARQTVEAARRGAEIYTVTCDSCHGKAGEGRVGPALRGTQLDEMALSKVIARGVPGTAMPAWSEEDGGPLKRHQVEDVVTFIRNWDSALLEGNTSPPTPTLLPAPTPALLPAPTPALLPAPTPALLPAPTLAPSPPSAPTLAPSPPSAGDSALVAGGKQLFIDSNCIVCHKINGEGGEFGPSLVGLFGRERELVTGEKVLADERYLRESLLDPNAKVAKGYPAGVMPKLGSERDIDALIAFIKSLVK